MSEGPNQNCDFYKHQEIVKNLEAADSLYPPLPFSLGERVSLKNFSSSWFSVTCYGQFALLVSKELNVCKHIILWTSDIAHWHDLSPYPL